MIGTIVGVKHTSRYVSLPPFNFLSCVCLRSNFSNLIVFSIIALFFHSDPFNECFIYFIYQAVDCKCVELLCYQLFCVIGSIHNRALNPAWIMRSL